MYRLIVAGGRDFDNYCLLDSKLDYFTMRIDFKLLEVVSGKARGADTFGEIWARERGVTVAEFPANWDKHGKSAGYIRNREMAEYSVANGNRGLLVAFWDGNSKGTRSMIDLGHSYGLDVRIVEYGQG